LRLEVNQKPICFFQSPEAEKKTNLKDF